MTDLSDFKRLVYEPEVAELRRRLEAAERERKEWKERATLYNDSLVRWVDRGEKAAAEVARLTARLADTKKALEEIRDTAHWYASVHQGPQHEVDHALKVEILDVAEKALESLAAVSGEPETQEPRGHQGYEACVVDSEGNCTRFSHHHALPAEEPR